MDPTLSLQKIGFTEKEARVYVTLLEFDRASAYLVALRSGLKKPTTYVVLDELVKKGMVIRTDEQKKQLYTARSPREIFIHAEEQLKGVREVLPALESISKTRTQKKLQTLFYEGMGGVEQALDYKIDATKEVIGYHTPLRNTPAPLLEHFKQYEQKLKQKNISARFITPIAMQTESGAGRASDVFLDVIDGAVRIVDGDNVQALIIENEEAAKALREVFEMVWNWNRRLEKTD